MSLTFVQVMEPRRAAEFRAIFGTDRVPVKSPVPMRALLPRRPDELVYLLDLGRLQSEQVERLMAHIARKFRLPVEEVRAGLLSDGVPVLAVDCVICTLDVQMHFFGA